MNKATLFDVLHDMKEEILKEPIGVIDNRCHHRKIKYFCKEYQGIPNLSTWNKTIFL